jgi:acyl dehydratase
MVRPVSGLGLPEVGARVSFSKTVGESDVYLFAGISGDLGPNHVNAEYMKHTPYGKIVAHGALMVGFMSACSTKLIDLGDRPAVSYGYDRLRFVGPVFVGDTVTVVYEVTERDLDDERTFARVTATNQHGAVVAAATHILKFL